MPDDAPSSRGGDTSRRAVLSSAAWVAPAIAATFVPAVAMSATSVPISKLRIGDDWTVTDGGKYDPVTNTVRGPLAIYASAHYDQNITWWPTRDPEPAMVQYTIEIVPPSPAVPTTLAGLFTIALGGYAQNLNWYPDENTYPIAAGTYSVTLTIYGSDGSTSRTTTITLT
ncbi:hypothetical protein [Microbacterium sp. RURRCA19A]|uniref:hypothetical protein n=1 Tax=Microbacterium sp. RURRCA19A TaxID=1907391 RepID=UPI00095462EA|nr:hypothetical protein [Microbacterium sp. RURRCA19A]SIR47497.1 hypothetical protein SAMN05880568_0116 [Microbacterium sp. RURRCA19A]